MATTPYRLMVGLRSTNILDGGMGMDTTPAGASKNRGDFV